MNKTCGNCALGPYCNLKSSLTECSNWKREIYFCDRCGSPIVEGGVVLDNKIICGNCRNALNTCAFCTFGSECKFETDPSPLPKVVMKTMRQGNMTMQSQIKNPERVALLCKDCKCFSDGTCNRNEFNYCVEYTETIS